jgi:hypothetical protein
MTVYADDDGNNSDGGDGDGGSKGNGNGNGNDAAAAADSDNVDEDYGGDLRMVIGQRQFDKDDGTTMMYVVNDGNGGDGRDGDGDSNGDGNGNGDDAAIAADGNNVNEDNSGNFRTTIGQQQLDDDDGMTMMRWRRVASNIQNACKCCAIHQSNNQLM